MNTAKIQKEYCHRSNESKQRDVYIYTIVTYTVATTFVGLRVISRIQVRKLAYDDCIVIVALLLTAIPVALNLKMAGIGFGEHIWNLEHGQLLSNLRYFYIAWSVYTFVLGLTKVSLILSYLQIFPTPRARAGGFVLLGLVVTNTMILVFVTIFNCIPVEAFWDYDIKEKKCLDINAIAYANSGSAIAQDVLLLIFPILCIWKLQMKTDRKVAVGCMFAIGTLYVTPGPASPQFLQKYSGCVATIVRLHTLLTFKTTIDPTWDYVPITVWTGIEISCIFVCVSIPSVRILLSSCLKPHISSRMTSAPETPGDNTRQSSIRQKRRGVKSWMHIPSEYDRTSARRSIDTEMEIMKSPEHGKQSEEGGMHELEEGRTLSGSEKELLSLRPSSSTVGVAT